MTIEGNKDEADRCIEIAKSALAEGRPDKAERFLQKAERLFPTQKAKDMFIVIERIRASQNYNSENEAPKPRETPGTPEARRRRPQTSQKEYTVEQLEAVKRINSKCKDYYEILSVTKESTDSDIKKSYKKLALQLHPDKNHAPGAAEAFKAVGNAAAILTDPERRKAYDARGDEPAPARRHAAYYARGFESDVTAEELFNMFFGAGGQHVYTRRRFTREPEQRENHNGTGLMQLLPILVLVLLSMLSGLFINDPVFSLTPSSKYPVQRETINLKVPYYVKENFHSDYQGSVRRLEMAVEEDFIVGLRHACQRERNYKETMTWKARNFGDNKQLQEAHKLRTPSCERLQSLQR